MNRKSQKVFALVSLGAIFVLLGSSIVLASPLAQVPVVAPSPTLEPTRTPAPGGDNSAEPMGGLNSPAGQGPPPGPTVDVPTDEPQPTSPPPQPTSPPPQPTSPPPQPTQPGPTSAPTGGPQTSDSEGKRGSSGKPHANSSISGFVTNHATGKGAPGIVVEIDASGWKDRTVTDDNGFYYFHGLSAGRAILNLALEGGGLPTNPNAVVSLTGHNEVRVELGFFPPGPTAAARMGAADATATAPVGSGEARATSGLEEGQEQENVVVSEPTATAPAEKETDQPAAEARLSGSPSGADQAVEERMPVTGQAAGFDYHERLLLGGVALGALVLLSRRVTRSLRH